MKPVRAIIINGCGQLLAAIGTLLGMRWLTSMVAPEVFGEVTLLIGGCGLAVNVLATPLIQAVIHEYSFQKSETGVAVLKKTFSRALWLVLGCAMLIVGLAALVAGVTNFGSWKTIGLLALILGVDSCRAAALGLLNAGNQNRVYVLWFVADAWMRAMLTIAFVRLFGSSVTSVLAAYLCGSGILLPLARGVLESPIASMVHINGASQFALRRKLWRYAWPLIPLGIIGWITGLADRYVIGGTLGLNEAGIYAAAAALASRPVLMLGTTLELVFRPRYQSAIAIEQSDHAQRILKWWLMLLAVTGVASVAMFVTLHEKLAGWLLGEHFRSGSYLMPWVASGYVLLIASYVFERICYAHAQTARVLSIQITTAVVAIVCLFSGAYQYGLMGAAIAVPIYSVVQLCAAIYYARRTQREEISYARSSYAQ